MGEIFRYISKKHGKFVIYKDGECYGDYDDIADALHDRDIYEDSGWDMTEALARNETRNKYRTMIIPSFDEYHKEKEDTKHIYYDGNYYVIQKKIRGVNKRFGYFNTLEEAKERRDELIKRGWIK